MKKRKGLSVLALAATMLTPMTASAALVSFSNPDPVVAAPLDTVTLDIVGTGFPLTDGGSFDVFWDPAVLTYVGTVFANPPWDASFAIDATAGTGTVTLGAGTFAASQGPDFDIASMAFTFNGGTTTVTMADALGGWSPAAVPLTATTRTPTAIDVDYGDITVNAVPLPAAAWLFGSALVGAGVFGRRKKTEA